MESSMKTHFLLFFFSIALLHLAIELKSTDNRYKTITKKKRPILYGQFKVICKNNGHISLLSSVKIFSEDIGMKFRLEKWASDMYYLRKTR